MLRAQTSSWEKNVNTVERSDMDLEDFEMPGEVGENTHSIFYNFNVSQILINRGI